MKSLANLPSQVFSSELYENVQNSCFKEHLWTGGPEFGLVHRVNYLFALGLQDCKILYIFSLDL